MESPRKGITKGGGKWIGEKCEWRLKKKKQIVLENTKVKTVNYFLSRQEEPREEWSWKEWGRLLYTNDETYS